MDSFLKLVQKYQSEGKSIHDLNLYLTNYSFENISTEELIQLERRKRVGIVDIKSRLRSKSSLHDQCVFCRNYAAPQSTIMEQIIKEKLKIDHQQDELSGDGGKNGYNYEIKVSLHDKKSKLHFVQIRPHHKIDYYILVGLNIYYGDHGKSYILKVPASNIYDLLPKYGGYAHGTVKENGIISKDNIEKNIKKECEYALRPDPNGKTNTKPYKLWVELSKFSVEYDDDLF